MTRADVTGQIIGKAIKVHRKLGLGLLESAYACELEKLGVHVQRQKAVPLIYEKVKLERSFRADLVIDGRGVVAIKCKETSTRWTKPSCGLISGCWIFTSGA